MTGLIDLTPDEKVLGLRLAHNLPQAIKPRLPRRYISDASTAGGLCGMTMHAGVLAYCSYALSPGDLELGLHINQLEAIAAAVTVATWPPGQDTQSTCAWTTRPWSTPSGGAPRGATR